jgi:hypothetical protein
MQRGIRLFGLPDPASTFLVSEPSSRCSARCRPPRAFAVGSSSRALYVPPEFLESPPARPSRAPPVGFLPSSRCRSAESTHAGIPARFVPSSAFRTPSTVFSSADLAGLFHPATTSRVRSSGSSPRAQPCGLVAHRCPLAVHTKPLPPVARWRQDVVPVSRALLHSRVRGERWWFRPPPTRYPPELPPSSGLSSRALRTTFAALSDRGLSRPSSSTQRST